MSIEFSKPGASGTGGAAGSVGTVDAVEPQALGVPGPAIGRFGELPGINLMPPELAERAAMQQLKVVCAGAVAVSLLVVGGLWYEAHSGVEHARTDLAASQQTQRTTQSQVADLQPVQQVYDQVASVQTQVAGALGSEIRWSQKLNDLSLSMPPGVWLTSMTVAPGASANGALATSGLATVSFQGMAENRNQVAGWLEQLVKEKGYSNPYVTTTGETVTGSRILISFTSTVTVTDAALSGRYTTMSGS